MSHFVIKICGLRTPSTVDAALNAGATWIGFNFVPQSVRYIHPATASALVKQIGDRARTVGLFADTPLETIVDTVRAVPLSMVQLHGQESEAAIGAAKAAVPGGVIAARGIAAASDLPGPQTIAPDFYIFDAAPPSDTDVRGGHGTPFDWRALTGYRQPTPWLLAGGLTPDNVASAVASVRHIPGFAGVDVASGVEKARGEKDAGLIADFVAAARAAMAPL
ncbi:phosphoribosylanthranilate isomerase [Parvularcula sp. LCG005]|uniref:phosphoribosylanthranilate isomerase n=1 Tax=Parvularcula sp. LCG005 TaxID=3078805 RepID=UPI002941E6EF|nr:phosphoribosylanthranilate isomerase [Parvularcula sp. LCG005]WOI53250.1 phosphoribosylanthranilate isomerase [Parvularcula sp. LCG005]